MGAREHESGVPQGSRAQAVLDPEQPGGVGGHRRGVQGHGPQASSVDRHRPMARGSGVCRPVLPVTFAGGYVLLMRHQDRGQACGRHGSSVCPGNEGLLFPVRVLDGALGVGRHRVRETEATVRARGRPLRNRGRARNVGDVPL